MARQDQQRYEAQLEALNQYRENYSGQLTERGSLGLTSFQFGHYQAFINKLDHAAQQQLQGLRQVRQVTEKRRQEWLEIQQQRKALETLMVQKGYVDPAALDAIVDGSDGSTYVRLLQAVTRPFEDRPEDADLLLPPRSEERVAATFCGT